MKSLLDTRSENLLTGPALLLAVAAIYFVKLLVLLPIVAVIYVALALYQSKLNLKSAFEGRRRQVIFIISGMLVLGYTLSALYNAQSYDLKFYAYLLYGPSLLAVAVFAYALEKEDAGLQALERYLPYLVAFQISALVFLSGQSLRQIALGQLFFLPFVIFATAKNNNWLKYVFGILSVAIILLTEERMFMVTGLLEMLAIVIYKSRFHVPKILVCVLILTIGFWVAQSALTKDHAKFLSGYIPMIQRYVDTDLRKMNTPDSPFYAEDRVGLIITTIRMINKDSIFGYSHLNEYSAIFSRSEPCKSEYFKHINCAFQPHAHNFFAKQMYLIGVFGLLYFLLIGIMFSAQPFFPLSLVLFSIYLIFGLAESPSPFYMFYVFGCLMARR